MSSTNTTSHTTRAIADSILTIPEGSVIEITTGGETISFVIHQVLVNPETGKHRFQPRNRLRIWWVEFGFTGVNGDMRVADVTIGFGKQGNRTCKLNDITIKPRGSEDFVTLSVFLETAMKGVPLN